MHEPTLTVDVSTANSVAVSLTCSLLQREEEVKAVYDFQELGGDLQVKAGDDTGESVKDTAEGEGDDWRQEEHGLIETDRLQQEAEASEVSSGRPWRWILDNDEPVGLLECAGCAAVKMACWEHCTKNTMMTVKKKTQNKMKTKIRFNRKLK